MSAFYRRLFIIIGCLTVLWTATPAYTATFVSDNLILGCYNLDGSLQFIADRDNSGSSAELVDFRVYDGNGKLLFDLPSGLLSLGALWSFEPDGRGYYWPYPEANPIHFEMTSLAGNGFDEELIYSRNDNCLDLPIPDMGTDFTDGRINPQTYAPVVLYCDGADLSVYSVDSTQVFTYTFASDTVAPESTVVIESGGGADLYALADGRYAVIAPQPDGKKYMVVFNGCPGGGAFEVYVTDPVTGQFVRSE